LGRFQWVFESPSVEPAVESVESGNILLQL
jgi:hypothetical protein